MDTREVVVYEVNRVRVVLDFLGELVRQSCESSHSICIVELVRLAYEVDSCSRSGRPLMTWRSQPRPVVGLYRVYSCNPALLSGEGSAIQLPKLNVYRTERGNRRDGAGSYIIERPVCQKETR